MRRVRIATFNLLNGRSPDAETVDVDRFCRAVARLDADVLALQEVDRAPAAVGWSRPDRARGRGHGRRSTTGSSAALTGTPDDWAGATGVEPDGTPAYGIALLSRYPVTAWSRRTPAAGSGADAPPSAPGACDWSGCATSPASPRGRRRDSDRTDARRGDAPVVPAGLERTSAAATGRAASAELRSDRAARRPEHVTAARATDHRHAALVVRADLPEPLARRTARPRAQ